MDIQQIASSVDDSIRVLSTVVAATIVPFVMDILKRFGAVRRNPQAATATICILGALGLWGLMGADRALIVSAVLHGFAAANLAAIFYEQAKKIDPERRMTERLSGVSKQAFYSGDRDRRKR